MFFDRDNWSEIGSALMRNKTRSFLTGFGIFWGVVMLLLLWGGGQGLAGYLAKNYEGFSTNSVALMTSRTSKSYNGFNIGRWWYLENRDIQAMRQFVPEIESFVPQVSFWGVNVSTDKHSTTAQVSGISDQSYEMMLPKLLKGRLLTSADNRQHNRVVVLGERVASEVFRGDEPLGQFVQVYGSSFLVVGVITDLGGVMVGGSAAELVQMPFSVVETVFNQVNRYDFLMLKIRDGYKYKDIRDKVEQVIFRNHNISPDDHQALSAIDVGEITDMIDMMLFGVRLLALIVGLGTLLAGMVGVSNIMMVVLKERTPEIGIRRALGARPSDIVKQFLSESILLTLLSGLSGMTFATAILAALQKALDTPFLLTFGESVFITAVFIVMGIVAGVLPARRAMRIKPIEAMMDR